MKYREFGKTGLKVSEIGFGGASIAGSGAGYGFGEVSEKEAIDLLLKALDCGVNLFDSAPIYGFSLSEKRMGEAFKNCREKVILTSKSGVSWHENKRVNMTNDPVTTQKMLERSLRDFKTEYIDLYMIHWPDENNDIRYAMEVLARAKFEGKIKYIGLCNTTREDYWKASEVSKIDFFQAEHNLFNHDFYQEFEPELNMSGFMGWGSFDKGILTGRVFKGRTYDRVDARSWAPWWKKQDLETKLSKVEKLKAFCETHKLTLLEFVVNANLSFKNLDTMLCGFKNIDDLETILKARQKEIAPELLREGMNLF